MSTENLASYVDGLHYLAENLDEIGIPASQVRVEIHTDHDGTNAGERLADGLGLGDRLDFRPGEFGAERRFTRWTGYLDGAQVTVLGETPKRPDGCCGKCPPIVGGGYDCTCEGNPRCTGREVQA